MAAPPVFPLFEHDWQGRLGDLTNANRWRGTLTRLIWLATTF